MQRCSPTLTSGTVSTFTSLQPVLGSSSAATNIGVGWCLSMVPSQDLGDDRIGHELQVLQCVTTFSCQISWVTELLTDIGAYI